MNLESPLATVANVGEWATLADVRVPKHFGDPSNEYAAALSSAALFDRSPTAKLEIAGPDAPTFLTNLSTNDLRELPLGGGCETYFLDHRAKTLFQAVAYHVLLSEKRHAIWLETTPGYGEKLFKHLDRYLISEAVELTDVTSQYAQLHLAGPTAKQVLESTLTEAVPELAEFQHMERTFGNRSVAAIRRRTILGVPGYDLVCANDHALGIWRMLVAAGATAAGVEAYETLRIEAGTPIYGVDIDETRFVMEIARVERAVSYAKGCFIGQEPIIMARDRAGQINRAFLGLKIHDTTPLPHGTKLTLNGQEVGVVTSSVVSPRLGAPIANAYLRRPHFDRGLVLQAQPSGVTVEVLGFPAVAMS
jgi:tRNA-modifying protein YgfZ